MRKKKVRNKTNIHLPLLYQTFHAITVQQQHNNTTTTPQQHHNNTTTTPQQHHNNTTTPQHATRNTQHATRNTQHATRSTQHATRNTQHAARNTQHATRNNTQQHATTRSTTKTLHGACPNNPSTSPLATQ
jgi:hypothetical protein